jgi:hypothetical protein
MKESTLCGEYLHPPSSKISSLTTASRRGHAPDRASPGCCACVQFFMEFVFGEDVEGVKAALPMPIV